MPIICECPKCHQPVTIPDGVNSDVEVRCPLCEAEYPLQEAMAELPPALVPVETETETAATADADATLKSDLISEPFYVGEPAKTEAETAESEAAEGEEAEAASETAGETTEQRPPTIDTGQTPVDTEAFTGFRVEGDDEEDQPAEGAPTAKRPRKRKQKSVAKEIVGALLGGFLGLALGYYLLNYFGGERFDFMEIPLPGVPHTYQHWDGWGGVDAEKPDKKTPPKESRLDSPGPSRPQYGLSHVACRLFKADDRRVMAIENVSRG